MDIPECPATGFLQGATHAHGVTGTVVVGAGFLDAFGLEDASFMFRFPATEPLSYVDLSPTAVTPSSANICFMYIPI